MNIRHFCFNPIEENSYLVWSKDGKAVIIDPGFSADEEKAKMFDTISSEGLTVEAILLTHGHFDHVLGLEQCVKAFNAPVYMHQDDLPVLRGSSAMAGRMGIRADLPDVQTNGLEDGQTLDLAGERWEVITTPGHSPGSVCFHIPAQKLLFSGDTLFRGTIGRSDLPFGDYDKEIVSIMEKIMGLDSDTDVLPGHGPLTTIADERTGNPFLIPFNEKEIYDDGTEKVDGIEIKAM